MSSVTTIATVASALLSASAVVLATVELRNADKRASQARRDLLDERRVQFHLEQLVALSLALADFGASAPYEARLRIRLLPDGMVPKARKWCEDGPRQDTLLWEEFLSTRRDDEDWGTWIRDRVRREISAHLDSLIAEGEPSR